MLRLQWRQDLSWQSVVELRDLLPAKLDQIRKNRGILPPVIRCSSCGHVGPAKPPVISVRAMLISVRRFGIDAIEATKSRERDLERYRRKNRLDLLGRLSEESSPAECHNLIHKS